jgi:hypothetical protein
MKKIREIGPRPETILKEGRATAATSNDEPSHQRAFAVNSVLLAISVILLIVGYQWSRSPSSPKWPTDCLTRIPSCNPIGGHFSFGSSATIFVSNPSEPIAAFAEFFSNIEQLVVGADVPAGQKLNWIIQLSGSAIIPHPTFFPHEPSKTYSASEVSAAKYYGIGLTYIERAYMVKHLEIIEGTTIGPSNGYSVMKSVGDDPMLTWVNSGAGLSGQTLGRFIASNSAYKLGILPELIANLPGMTPGSSTDNAGGPEIGPPISGRWFNPSEAFLMESLPGDANSYSLDWAQPQPIGGNTMTWVSNSALGPTFAERNIDFQQGLSHRQFYAGISLGVAGGTLIAAVQGYLSAEWRRKRRLRLKRPSDLL